MKKELKNTKKKNNKGFSLVELIVVIAIMAVLMAVLAPAMLRYVEKSRVQKDESAVSEVINAVNNALADETVNNACSESDTIVVANKSITGSQAVLVKEVQNTITASKLNLTSKEFSGMQYTIHLVKGADGTTLQAADYVGITKDADGKVTNSGNWSKKAGN